MINDDLAAELLSRELNLNRFDADLRTRVSKELSKLDADILNKLRGNPSNWNRTEFNEKLRDVRKVINDYYAEISDMTAKDMAGLSESEAIFLQSTINELADAELIPEIPSKDQLSSLSKGAIIQGAILASWWLKQAADTYFRVSTQTRIGYGSGETNVTERVSDQLKVSQRNAESVVRTSVRTVASDTREKIYAINSSIFKGKLYVAVLDNRTSIQCIAYDGSTYDMDNKPIGKKSLPYRELPAHFNCRSIYVPILKSAKEVGFDIPRSTRSSMDGQVPENMNFKDFLEKKGKAFQDEVLGKGKAQLWRDGKITLQQLLDQTGNPIPLKELDK
jgi:SPP1 gp7 family putative phage head morphogenesis protein